MMRVAFVLILLLWSSIAYAEKRVALIIGNGAYTNVPKLDNPKNDAAAMEAMFKAAGFDTVVLVNDLGGTAMRRALRDFSDTAHNADVAIVFFAGHGIEVSGTNYLIPTDAVLERDIDARDEAVPLDRVNEMLESVKRLRLVILDACRDNPFVRSMRRTLASRSVRSGYGEIDEKSLPPNTLVAYAQRTGATAEDGTGANSPYTTALLKHLPTPGLDIELALRRVRDDVLKTTRNRQEPFKYGSLGGTEIALVPSKEQQQTAPAAPPKPAIDYDKEMEITFWNAVKDGKSKDLLQTYLDRYPAGNFAGLAKVLIEQLDREERATRLAAERDAQAQLAEAERVAAEAKRAEELRKAGPLRQEEARAEVQRAQEAIRKAEADRVAALKEAEDARRDAEAARAEQKRLAGLSAQAAAGQKSSVVASLPPGPQGTTAAKPEHAEKDLADQTALVRALQTELKRVGCDPGTLGGKWERKSREALNRFTRFAKITVPTDEPSEEALRAVAGQKDRVCPLVCRIDQIEVNGKCTAKKTREPKLAREPSNQHKEQPAKSKGLCFKQGGWNGTVGPCP